MIRTLDVEVDRESWKPGSVPTRLRARVGRRQVNVLEALLFTAITTCPPTAFGFHLSDFWAWLRYEPAIASTPSLRLREEWTDVDSHQKSVLSDELGVGFTTQFVTEALDCLEFTDTIYVVKILEPNKFKFKKGAKVGPRKSPDYIARDRQSKYIVLECKGSQASRAALKKAIANGQTQKKNVVATKPSSISHSLVAGLFIPQWFVKDDPCIIVSDPTWNELDEVLSQWPTEQIDEAITQVALAKQLALVGFTELPRYLISAPARELGRLPEASKDEILGRPELLTEHYQPIFNSGDLRLRIERNQVLANVTFSALVPASILNELTGADRVSDLVAAWAKRSLKGSWSSKTTESITELNTPLAFGFRLEGQAR
jgi:hypothetical protein